MYMDEMGSIWHIIVLLGISVLIRTSTEAVDLESAPQPPPDPPASEVPEFVSSPIRGKHENFLRDVIHILLKDGVFFNEGTEENGPFHWRSPEELSQELGPVLELGEHGSNHEDLLAIISRVINFSPRPSHRYMLDKRVAGLDPYALVADWLISTVNGNGATYNLAPVFILMELEMVQRLSGMFGWKLDESDGITTPGAGAANAMAVTLALQEKFPGLKETGLYGSSRAAIFVSELASFQYEKAARYQGQRGKRIIVIKVLTDSQTGRMDLEDLRTQIENAKSEGFVPFMVVGTAGADNLGSIDDLDRIPPVCHEHGLWFHVDADKGGPLIFSPTLQSRLRGIKLANSVTFGSWMVATPYVTTMLLVQNRAAATGVGVGTQKLQTAFGTHARYLYKSGADLYNGSYDNGDSTVQASRRMEVVKLWYSWRARGTDGLARLVETVCNNAALFTQEVTKRKHSPDGPGFKLMLWTTETATPTPDVPLVAFNYIPKKLAGLQKEGEEFVAKMTKATRDIKAKLLEQNLMKISIGSSISPSQPDFFVVSLTNSVLQPSDFRYILDLIETVAESENEAPQALPRPPLVGPTSPTSGSTNENFPLKSSHQTLFEDVFQLFLNKGIFFNRVESPHEFMEPDYLRTHFDLKTLENRAPATHDDMLQEFEKALKYSPHRGHPYFFFQLLAGLDPYTLAADYVASALNTPMRTYEDSPVFTLMERKLLAAFRQRVFGTSEGDGVVTDGGSMANQMAIALALQGKMKNTKLRRGKTFVGFMSQDAHYSTRKGSVLQNLGSENLIEVESNERGQMRPEKLEAAIKQTLSDGDVPFFVCMTAGTTVYGAIDPVAQIVDLCAKYELWCHVDGMVGGLLAMSDQHRHRLAGLERVDSVGTDLHKLMGATLTIAVLVTRRSGIFRDTFGAEVGQTQVDHLYNRTEWDQAAFHYQTDRRNNIFKFWFLWKAKGRLGFEGHVNLVMDNTAYLVRQLHRRKDDGFLPVLPEYDLTNVCFYYVPRALRKFNHNGTFTDFEAAVRLGQISYYLEKVLTKNGVMAVVAQQRFQNSQPAFLKFVMMGSSLTKADVHYLLDAVAYYGEKLIT